jgi:uncharacterized RDD family membrane protein YckC
MTNPYAPPRAAVQDVADPNAQSVPADRGTRLGATLLDGLIFAALVYVPILLFFVLGGATRATTGEANVGAILVAGSAVGLVGFGVWCWFTIAYVQQNGQSIAKRLLGIKVVRADGTPVSLGRLFWLRNVVNGLVGIVPFYALLDMLFIFGESRQCLHDKIADTIVVKA